MKLNHLNLTVTDVRAAVEFLEKYFGLRRQGGNAGMAFLSDDDGFVLTLMRPARPPTSPTPGAFILASLWAASSRSMRSTGA
jgi:catechol 2,3-dioxygenase-like lactoylglutathione lyase family enzyme